MATILKIPEPSFTRPGLDKARRQPQNIDTGHRPHFEVVSRAICLNYVTEPNLPVTAAGPIELVWWLLAMVHTTSYN